MLNTVAAPARWRARALRAVLFDLDGTLLDTAADIALGLNRALADHGWPPVPADAVHSMIGRGTPILIERAAQFHGRALDPALQGELLDRFFHHYGALEESGDCVARVYDGGADTLRQLHEAGVRIAVVTNKYHRFATALLKLRGLSGWVDCVVGGDTCERRKPDPQPLQLACKRLQAFTTRALMVGDSLNDVLAARAAGMPVVCVPYGYNEGNDSRTLPCDAFIESVAELRSLLDGESAQA